ncbi:MAG: hypothetical protein HC844_13035 [Tabrizicola sp.]|nr:hypothetical protein [Tabrizicola sp.]
MRKLGLVLALCIGTPLAAEDIPGSNFEVGYWKGGAQTNSATGAFNRCYASVGFTAGETVWLNLYPDDVFEILLANPSIKYRPGEKFEGIIMTEVGVPWFGNASAVDENFAGMSFTGAELTMDFLAQGVYLRLLGIGIDQSFDVRGIGTAMAKMRLCAAQYGSGKPASGLGAGTGAGAGTGGGAVGGAASPFPPTKKPEGGAGTGLGAGGGGGLGVPAPRPSP